MVVKHVIRAEPVPNLNVATLTQTAGKDSVRFSETSMSPRFHGSGVPPYYEQPEKLTREILDTLQKGMGDLQRFQTKCKENRDPMNNLQSLPIDPSSDILKHIGELPPYLSQMIVNPGAGADIMNMGMDELETLRQ